SGMDKETRERIFEPFFTTKDGKGTGLGLSSVYGVIRQSGGNIEVHSAPGKGTTFRIFLPMTKDKIDKEKQEIIDYKSLEGKGTILVVEDDRKVLSSINRILVVYGYTVIEASSGDAALKISKKYPDDIHMVITDIIMPGKLSGSQLAEQLIKQRPKIKVLYISGYTENDIVHRGQLDPGLSFLQKPFTPKGLAAKIKEIMKS
ncbi:response regulator, partial [Elusimicrobiota bacterium]